MTMRTLSTCLRRSIMIIPVVFGPLGFTASLPASAATSQAPVSGGNAQSAYLSQVSCVGSSFCMAAGNVFGLTQGTLAEVWDGTSWSVADSPNDGSGNFQGVSCISSTSCTAVGAVGNDTLAETWNGSTWTVDTTPNPYPDSFYYAVSCVADTSFCMAVGSDERYETALSASSDAGTWTNQPVPEPDEGEFNTLQGVSCISETFCMADGETAGNNTLVEMWDGTSWTAETTPDPNPQGVSDPNEMTDISCSSTSWCMGSMFGPYTLSWNGATWSDESVAIPHGAKAVEPFAISCISQTACTATGYYTNSSGLDLPLSEIWNGTSWSLQDIPVPDTKVGVDLTGLSCTGPGACVTAGEFSKNRKSPSQGLTESETSGTWALVDTPPVETVSLSRQSGLPDAAVTVSGFGFAQGDPIKILFEPGNVKICQTKATTNGAFSCNAHIPSVQIAHPGTHEIQSEGPDKLAWETTFTVK